MNDRDCMRTYGKRSRRALLRHRTINMLTLIMSYRRMFFFLLVPIHQPLGGTSQSPLRGNRLLKFRRSPGLYFRRQKLIQYLRETGRDNHQSIRSQQCFKKPPTRSAPSSLPSPLPRVSLHVASYG